MKKIFRLLIFLIAFQTEVRVKASADTWLQQPEKCLSSTESACSVQALQAPFHYSHKNLSLHATKGSTLSRLQGDQWRLVEGSLWVEKGAPSIETVYARISAKEGQFWVLEQKDRVVLRNMDADLDITLRDGQKINLPAGFEVWVAGINSLGKSEHGVIRPVDMAEHLPLWKSMYQGSNKKFVEEVHDLHDRWGDLVEKSSAMYEGSIRRGLASAADRDQKEKEAARQKAAEKQKLHDLFWSRAFER